jgi:hypothetical protein
VKNTPQNLNFANPPLAILVRRAILDLRLDFDLKLGVLVGCVGVALNEPVRLPWHRSTRFSLRTENSSVIETIRHFGDLGRSTLQPALDKNCQRPIGRSAIFFG